MTGVGDEDSHNHFMTRNRSNAETYPSQLTLESNRSLKTDTSKNFTADSSQLLDSQDIPVEKLNEFQSQTSLPSQTSFIVKMSQGSDDTHHQNLQENSKGPDEEEQVLLFDHRKEARDFTDCFVRCQIREIDQELKETNKRLASLQIQAERIQEQTASKQDLELLQEKIREQFNSLTGQLNALRSDMTCLQNQLHQDRKQQTESITRSNHQVLEEAKKSWSLLQDSLRDEVSVKFHSLSTQLKDVSDAVDSKQVCHHPVNPVVHEVSVQCLVNDVISKEIQTEFPSFFTQAIQTEDDDDEGEEEASEGSDEASLDLDVTKESEENKSDQVEESVDKEPIVNQETFDAIRNEVMEVEAQNPLEESREVKSQERGDVSWVEDQLKETTCIDTTDLPFESSVNSITEETTLKSVKRPKLDLSLDSPVDSSVETNEIRSSADVDWFEEETSFLEEESFEWF